MKKLLLLCTLSLILGMSGVASATLINGGFETGDFTGWNDLNGTLSNVVSGHMGSDNAYNPIEGTYFAELKAGASVSAVTGITQTFDLQAGDVLSGFAAFDNKDCDSNNDRAFVRIYDSNGNPYATPWAEVGSDHLCYYDGPWTAWSFTPAADGRFSVMFAVVQGQLGGGNPSYALFDAATVSAGPVPEPATVFLLGSGLVGLAGFGRKKFKK